MKKILLAIALVCTMSFAYAQNPANQQAVAAVKSAEAATENPKKAAKTATWLKLAKCYVEAYDAPQSGIMMNMNKTDLQLLLGKQKVKKVEQVTLEGQPCTKEIYNDKELYFNQNNVLFMVDVLKYPVPDALVKAMEAYKKAYELDVKHKKSKDLKNGIEGISSRYITEGMNKYTLGDFKTASEKFAAAYEAALTEPLCKVDTTMLYNAGFTAWMVKDFEHAKEYFEKCLGYGYYYEGGEVFAKLGDIYTQLGDKESSRKVLEDGFVKFPQSQSILIGLINYYLADENADAGRLFELLDVAKKNEPNNASLYYVEGNINKELGKIEAAVVAYRKCAQIDPKYAFGHIGEGLLFYNSALEILEKAQNEMDDAKYNQLVEDYFAELIKAVEPFEKAYSTTSDESLKNSVAEYLKNIYYRLISKDEATYKPLYDKYNELFKG